MPGEIIDRRQTTSLEIVSDPSRHDWLLLPDRLPAFSGEEDSCLTCGSCGALLALGVSPKTLRRRFRAGYRLLLRCSCGRFNLLTGVAKKPWLGRRAAPS